MTIGISDEHQALHHAARGSIARFCPPSVPRALLDAENEERPSFWAALCETGWLGLHVAEEHGGSGYGLAELVVVIEELGRAVVPGAFVPSAVCSAALQRAGTTEQQARLLPGLAAGTTVSALALAEEPLEGIESAGAVRVTGELPVVIGGAIADLVLAPVRIGATARWMVLDLADASMKPLPSLDATRRVAQVRFDGVEAPPGDVLAGDPPVLGLARLLLSAEAVGLAAWCVETSAAYARDRIQFGRPIGQFQGTKHRCANMLVALEHARAAVWDAARAWDAGAAPEEVALATTIAAALAPEAGARCAKDCIQVHGGIGFTWEHDAHLYLKRAVSIRQLVGSPSVARREAARLAVGGTRRSLSVELPPGAASYRAGVRAFLAELQTHPKSEWNVRIADSGYLVPHWPAPYGRDAGPVEQLVIDEEFRAVRVRRAHLAVGAWALPTIIEHGTDEQKARFVPPTMRLELRWCQMFSEPGAGSDLASLATRAERGTGPDGQPGWVLNGQKVWTSMAREADFGICLARTDPDAPKHDGITCFLVDTRSPGLDIRPLRELTGHEFFNEVFFDDVFVPDDCVVGAVNDGWRAGRTTLTNERVSMGSGASYGLGLEALLGMVQAAADDVVLDELGALVCEAHAQAVLGLRATLRSVAGGQPGPESSVRKLAGVEHDQHVQELGLSLMGRAGLRTDGEAALWSYGFLANRQLSIAGGTSEIQRNVIAERLLGLPRDP